MSQDQPSITSKLSQKSDAEKLVHAFVTSGFSYCNNLFSGLSQKTVQQLQSKFSLSKSQFFRYLQLRHYVLQATRSYQLSPENNALFKSLLSPQKQNT